MSDKLGSPQSQTDEHKEKYFSFQIKGWTKFDPMDKTLATIAEGIARGGGFLTLVEVLKIENDLASIGDEEARECFANVLAAERLVRTIHELPENLIEGLRSALKTELAAEVAAERVIRTVHELPKNLIEELRSSLKTEEQAVPKKTVGSVANAPVSNAKRWP
jgi:hypothetical protein